MKPATISRRAVRPVRRALGERLRTLRKARGLSQEGLGAGAGLSGKFVGEVERGEKSVSIDSLFHLSTALQVSLRELTDLGGRITPPADVDRIVVLLSRERRPERIRRAYDVLRAMFGRAR
jgi:transcriptional regulator with XRE-family HTH domain